MDFEGMQDSISEAAPGRTIFQARNVVLACTEQLIPPPTHTFVTQQHTGSVTNMLHGTSKPRVALRF
ncbi:MAG: hypothetical protein DMG34_04350 [Acidobacteria bacterium]|nr:MAG: hypothetical protein DMG34_04350 [Acidobacteriota bacterium]